MATLHSPRRSDSQEPLDRSTDRIARQANALASRSATRVHTQITRNGVQMAFIALFAVLGGSIRGFNLLVILSGLMVGILMVQWRFCRTALPQLSVRRHLPPEAYAGRSFKVRFVVANQRAWLPTWLLRLEDRIVGGTVKTHRGAAVTTVAIVHPRSSENVHYDCVIGDRGLYRFGPVRLVSGFPFGLVNAWRNTRTSAPLLVYPSLARLTPNWGGLIYTRREGLSHSRSNSGPNEGQFFGIRSWRSGDSRRWIHWRTTARIQQLAVRQFEQRNRTQISLLLDPFLQADSEDKNVEWAISVAASIAAELSIGATNRLTLGIADHAARSLSSHRITDFRRAAMELLAHTRPLANPPLATTLERVLCDADPNWPVLIVSPRRSRFDLLTSDGHGKGLTPSLVARLDLIWLDVTSTAADRIVIRDPPRGTS